MTEFTPLATYEISKKVAQKIKFEQKKASDDDQFWILDVEVTGEDNLIIFAPNASILVQTIIKDMSEESKPTGIAYSLKKNRDDASGDDIEHLKNCICTCLRSSVEIQLDCDRILENYHDLNREPPKVLSEGKNLTEKRIIDLIQVYNAAEKENASVAYSSFERQRRLKQTSISKDIQSPVYAVSACSQEPLSMFCIPVQYYYKTKITNYFPITLKKFVSSLKWYAEHGYNIAPAKLPYARSFRPTRYRLVSVQAEGK